MKVHLLSVLFKYQEHQAALIQVAGCWLVLVAARTVLSTTMTKSRWDICTKIILIEIQGPVVHSTGPYFLQLYLGTQFYFK